MSDNHSKPADRTSVAVINVPTLSITGATLVGDAGEMSLFFSQTLYGFDLATGAAVPEQQVVCRVRMNPVVAKALSQSLSQYVSDYERDVSKIPSPTASLKPFISSGS